MTTQLCPSNGRTAALHARRQHVWPAPTRPRATALQVRAAASGRGDGPVLVVTGAASGIGRAIAVAFAGVRDEASSTPCIVLSDRDEAGGQHTVQLVKEAGGDALFVPTDVASEESVVKLAERVKREYGRLHYSCINAGIGGPPAPIHQCPTEDFDRVLGVNLRGAWLCMKHLIPLHLDTGNEGAMVLMSSVAGVAGLPFASPYTASKHAVVGLARCAAQEYAGQLRVNTMNPGFIETPLVTSALDNPAFGGYITQYIAATTMKRMGRTDEIADGVLYMLTKATYMTGQTMVLDGGALCK